jgi:predicted Zn finger-like uncharacterized protein
MTVYCSYCSTGYLLPDHLLGPRGARVRCPKCAKTFVVLRDPATVPARGDAPALESPAPALESPAPEPPPPVDAALSPETGSAVADGPAGEEPAAVARHVLGAMAARLAERLERARAAGRVLSEFGPDLMSAYDDYRRRVGPGASPVPFKNELRERLGVDLLTGVEP